MAKKPSQPAKQTIPPIVEPVLAPFIYFDEAPNFGCANGIVNLTLAAYRNVPAGTGAIATDLVIIAHLRCHVSAAKALRNALDQAILLDAPAPDQIN